ncbi:6443e40b-5521-4036-9eba-268b507e897a [Sclerotinia trifoliorum]|uniref:6443e40b-5521-4036-9eba-268b507e897a n=1 Tax=Sclerotinia trifoliorum TaxID=28548 RepID=A0A8H2W3H0_9HELO|nr:6443e40b-5521-4036-9eba-268b507e897a [Sclerotinia trifoliorum]
MAPLIDTNSSDSEGDDMSDTIEPSCPTMATTPPSPQTPKTKSKSSKRSIDITPTACSMSRLNAETVEHANLEVRSVGKDTGAGDSPSPTKKRRISRLSVQEKDSGPFTSLFCRNSLFKVDENEEVLPFDEGSEKTCERVEHDLSQEKERMVEVEKLFLDHIAFCGGNKQKKMAPKIGRSGSDTAYAASLNNLVDGEVYAKEETHGKFKLAIRTENLEKGIRSVQAREERAEMDVTPLESLDVDMPGSSEFALGNKNLSKTVQSVRGRKGRTEMALKTLELLNGMAETDSSKGWGEMRSLADGFERVIVRLELEENLQMALEKKEGAEIYPKEMETLNDEVGTRKRKTLPRTKILKSFIIGRLEEDLQMLKETLETSFERLECLNDETETSFNKAKEAQLRMDITSDAALLLENDREVRIPPANEDEVVTMEDIRDKIPEASTSAAELLTNQDSTISQAGSLPGSTNQGSTHMRGLQ